MRTTLTLLCCVCFLSGCSADNNDASQPIATDSGLRKPGHSAYSYDEISNIVFLDDVASNAELATAVTDLSFQNLSGEEVAVKDYVKGKSVVVVVTRGNTNPICPYCTTQVARLIGRYPEISALKAEVIAVYPVQLNQQEKVREFLKEAKTKVEADTSIPFPILLDVNLRGVDILGIRKNLSKPATYIIDPDGVVRFAYIGANRADRPSVDAIIRELKTIQSEATPQTRPTESPLSESE